MFELLVGLTVIVTTSLVLGHGKEDLYDTTKAGSCTAEDYDLVK